MSEQIKEEDYIIRMAKEHANDSGAISSPLLTGDNDDQVVASVVAFSRYQGYLTTPAENKSNFADNRPCLIVIHEWWGLNAQIQTVTRQLASQGYDALAVDLYGKPAATDVKTARKYMKECFKVKDGYCMDCLKEAVNYFKHRKTSQQGKLHIGVIGWCLGGMFALHLALAVPADIQACVIYYGNLETEKEKLEALQSPVLGIFGGADRGIPLDSVNAFKQTLSNLEKEHEIHIYDGADHAFCNPTGNRYQEEPARDAWEKTLDFLARCLK